MNWVITEISTPKNLIALSIRLGGATVAFFIVILIDSIIQKNTKKNTEKNTKRSRKKNKKFKKVFQ